MVFLIVNIHFVEDDPTWTQVTLSVKNWSLWIRSAVQLAPSVYLASAAACSELVCHILPPRAPSSIPTPNQEEAKKMWSPGHSKSPPDGTGKNYQKVWDSARVTATASKLLVNASDERSHAHLMAASSRESGVWLNATPCSSLGLNMEDNTIWVAVGVWLRCSLCKPHTCHHCGANVDASATHSLSCRQSEATTSSIPQYDPIHRALSADKIPSWLEHSGWHHNGPMGVWQAIGVGRLLHRYLRTFICSKCHQWGRCSVCYGRDEEEGKVKQLESIALLLTVEVETQGAFVPDAFLYLKELGHRSDWRDQVIAFLIQWLLVSIHKRNRACVMEILGNNSNIEDFFNWIFKYVDLLFF